MMNKVYRIGKVVIWFSSYNYEHPSRWAGIWLPWLGEFEVVVTSNKVKSRVDMEYSEDELIEDEEA